MIEYLDTSIVNAFRQIVGGFGLIFVLAFLMWTMSRRRRGIGGGWLGLAWLLIGLLWCCTIIGIPFGVACFRIAGFSFCPFGKKLVPSGDAGLGTAIFNIIWIVFAGFWLALGSALLGVAYCLTIIGIPWGIACFNIAQASFAPLGKVVVKK